MSSWLEVKDKEKEGARTGLIGVDTGLKIPELGQTVPTVVTDGTGSTMEL